MDKTSQMVILGR